MLREQIIAGRGGWRTLPKAWRTTFGMDDQESRDVKDELESPRFRKWKREMPWREEHMQMS